MKQHKDYTVILIIIVFIISFFTRCTPRMITGPVTTVNGNIITVNGHRFKVNTDTVKVGSIVYFTRTYNRSKITAKKLN